MLLIAVAFKHHARVLPIYVRPGRVYVPHQGT